MDEVFIYQRFYDVGNDMKNAVDRINGELAGLIIQLEKLINDARNANIDPQVIDYMVTVRHSIHRVKKYADEVLGYYSRLVIDYVKNELLKYVDGKICTDNDLRELVNRV
jgi:hypothetical protein